MQTCSHLTHCTLHTLAVVWDAIHVNAEQAHHFHDSSSALGEDRSFFVRWMYGVQKTVVFFRDSDAP